MDTLNNPLALELIILCSPLAFRSTEQTKHSNA